MLVLSARKDVKAVESKPACAIEHGIGVAGDDGDMNTHKYDNTVHLVFDGMDPSFIMALCFT